jgi:hypothetical protein
MKALPAIVLLASLMSGCSSVRHWPPIIVHTPPAIRISYGHANPETIPVVRHHK